MREWRLTTPLGSGQSGTTRGWSAGGDDGHVRWPATRNRPQLVAPAAHGRDGRNRPRPRHTDGDRHSDRSGGPHQCGKEPDRRLTTSQGQAEQDGRHRVGQGHRQRYAVSVGERRHRRADRTGRRAHSVKMVPGTIEPRAAPPWRGHHQRLVQEQLSESHGNDHGPGSQPAAGEEEGGPDCRTAEHHGCRQRGWRPARQHVSAHRQGERCDGKAEGSGEPQRAHLRRRHGHHCKRRVLRGR